MPTMVFEYSSYKKYLNSYFAKESRRGVKKKFAEALGCQPSFLSRVLGADNYNLSLEQAVRANQFLQHSKNEAHFFILLVEYERAGSIDLRDQFFSLIDEFSKIYLKDFKSQLGFSGSHLSEKDQTQFYSSWHYLAILMACKLPTINTISDLVSYFHLKEEFVLESINFLEKTGLLVVKKDKISINFDNIQEEPSIITKRNDLNWRIKALGKHELGFTDDEFHLTALTTVSKSELIQIKSILTDAIEKSSKVSQQSKKEHLVCINLDIFEVE